MDCFYAAKPKAHPVFDGLRELDPLLVVPADANQTGLSKRFFNPNTLTVFDQHYTKKP